MKRVGAILIIFAWIFFILLAGGLFAGGEAENTDGFVFLPIISKSGEVSEEFLMVQRFAPVLKFDGSYKGLPMSAEDYFLEMMNVHNVSPIISETILITDTIYWQAEENPLPDGLFPNVTGWSDPTNYETIQTADVDGDGQAELLARASDGMETWKFNLTTHKWDLVGRQSPPWTDPGWAAIDNYSTIQTADVDGDGQAELLARASDGMETWEFNLTTNEWDLVKRESPPWTDPGWAAIDNYSTIQTADVDGDGQAELLARASDGMETWKFNLTTNEWDLVKRESPPWTDAGGWSDPTNYETIQTADVDGDGQAELLARASDGIETWKFNLTTDEWDLVKRERPPWTDAGGWNEQRYYSTIQTADVDGDGQAELLGRAANGMATFKFNSDTTTWDLLVDANPDWNDAGGWNQPRYYSTIQTADVDGDGQDELLARAANGMATFKFNSDTTTWDLLVDANPDWNDEGGWGGDPMYYSTIQTADVDGNGKADLLARSYGGMFTFKYITFMDNWVLLNGPKRTELCGEDTCKWGMSNEDFDTLNRGEVPTYYRVIYGGDGRARIAYWWFYGWQARCNPTSIGPDGTHHGDWEHILVTTSPDQSTIDYVTYYLHDVWYTRNEFEKVGTRPVVYVGKLAHGSYHNQDCSGAPVSQCCHYADYRDPTENTVWFTDRNLVNLDENSESWILADRVGQQYEYEGKSYKIIGWNWGPPPNIGTHPTVHPLDWTIPSCTEEGCGDYNAGCPYLCDYDHNQPWPWDSSFTSNVFLNKTSKTCDG